MRFKLFGGPILILAALCYDSAQDTGWPTNTQPHIILKLPENIASDAVTIWRGVMGESSKIGPVKRLPNAREYVIDVSIAGHPAQYAKIYVYSPGCQFKTYEVKLSGTAEVEERFACVPLPNKAIRGFLAPSKIPHSKSSNSEELDVTGELEANWICSDFFLRIADRSHSIVGGSCFVPSIQLGGVGTLHRAAGGRFEITIPDFTQDPAFNDARRKQVGDFDVIELALRDRIGDILETIAAKDLDDGHGGLAIRSEYPDTVNFTPFLTVAKSP